MHTTSYMTCVECGDRAPVGRPGWWTAEGYLVLRRYGLAAPREARAVADELAFCGPACLVAWLERQAAVLLAPAEDAP